MEDKEKWDILQKPEVALVHRTISQSLSRFETKRFDSNATTEFNY